MRIRYPGSILFGDHSAVVHHTFGEQVGIRVDVGRAGSYQPNRLHAGVREGRVARELAQALDGVLEGIHHDAEVLCIQLVYDGYISN